MYLFYILDIYLYPLEPTCIIHTVYPTPIQWNAKVCAPLTFFFSPYGKFGENKQNIAVFYNLSASSKKLRKVISFKMKPGCILQQDTNLKRLQKSTEK